MSRPGRALFALALAGDLLGSGGALLVAGRPWQTVSVARSRPLADEVVRISGHALEPAITAIGLVAMAGGVAALATRGRARRIVGAVIALAGTALLAPAVAAFNAMSPSRARELVSAARSGIGFAPTQTPRVSVHHGWPALMVGCALVVIAAGALILLFGRSWAGLSTRYEAPAAAGEVEPPSTDAELWNALDRGDDPTVRTEP